MLIVGLGNPGAEYAKTRHNLGFIVIDKLAEKLGFPSWEKQNKSKVTSGKFAGRELILAKPQTYMNLSGNAVLSLMAAYKINPENIIIITDDIALPFGKIRFRPSGGDGGHKGLFSIIEKIGRSDIIRMRVGVGSPLDEEDAADYVLSEFTQEETSQLPEIIKSCIEAIETFLTEDINTAMNRHN